MCVCVFFSSVCPFWKKSPYFTWLLRWIWHQDWKRLVPAFQCLQPMKHCALRQRHPVAMVCSFLGLADFRESRRPAMRRRPCIFCSILRPCAHWSRAYDWASTRGKHGDMIYGAKRLRWANATLADVFHKNNQPNTGSFGHFPCQVPSQASTSWEEEVCLCNKSIHHNSSPFAKWTCSQAMWPKNLYIWLVIGYGDYTTSHTGITIIHCGNPY